MRASQSSNPSLSSLLFSTFCCGLVASQQAALPAFASAALMIADIVPDVEAFSVRDLTKPISNAITPYRPQGQAGVFGNLLKGIFSPSDFFMPTDSMNRLIDKAQHAASSVVWEAGKEARLTIGEAGTEMRTTIKAAGDEGRQLIADFGGVGKVLIDQTGEQVRITTDHAFNHAENLISVAGVQFKLSAQVVGEEVRCTIHQAALEANLVIDHGGRTLTGVVETAATATNQVMVNFAELGNVMIENAGNELRYTFDESLQGLVAGSEAVLTTAGTEARLTVHEIRDSVTDVVTHSTTELKGLTTHVGDETLRVGSQVPRLSRLAAESFAAGFANTLKDSVWGTTEQQKIIIAMDNAIRENPNITIEALLELIVPKDYISPREKAELYIKLLEYINLSTVIDKADKDRLNIIVASAAMVDHMLYEVTSYGFFDMTTNHTTKVLARVEDAAVRAAVESQDTDQLLRFFDMDHLPPVNDGTLPIGTVIAFPGSTLPGDFVDCDGRELRAKDYPALYKALGRQYGYRVDADGNVYFNIPDYRNEFLRGFDAQAASIHPLGSHETDATRMPGTPFTVEAAGSHSHEASESGSHLHTIELNGQHSHDITPNGSHDHKANPNGKHSHGMSSNGGHTHTVKVATGRKRTRLNDGPIDYLGEYEEGHKNRRSPTTTKANDHQHTIHSVDAHTHTIEKNGQHSHDILTAGNHDHSMTTAGVHNHAIHSAGTHTHSLVGGDIETRPHNVRVRYAIKYQTTVPEVYAEVAELKEELAATQQRYDSRLWATQAAAATAVVASVTTAAVALCKR